MPTSMWPLLRRWLGKHQRNKTPGAVVLDGSRCSHWAFLSSREHSASRRTLSRYSSLAAFWMAFSASIRCRIARRDSPLAFPPRRESSRCRSYGMVWKGIRFFSFAIVPTSSRFALGSFSKACNIAVARVDTSQHLCCYSRQRGYSSAQYFSIRTL